MQKEETNIQTIHRDIRLPERGSNDCVSCLVEWSEAEYSGSRDVQDGDTDEISYDKKRWKDRGHKGLLAPE